MYSKKSSLKLKLIVTVLVVFIVFAAFESYSISASASTLNLPQTGQTSCWDANGTSVACSGTGQDGDIKAGVAWPSPRSTDNGDQTMTDTLTGLMWTKNAGTPTIGSCTGGAMAWTNALDYVACLNTANYLGYNDWRLPNINELESLVNAEQNYVSTWLGSQGYTNMQSYYYWSSTTRASDTSYAWLVSMIDGIVGFNVKSSNFYVWPVRTGQSGPYGNSAIWKTGQTQSYHSGDDGAFQTGVAWPSPRFIDNSDGTVTDNLTGLMWTKNANIAGRNWQQALDYVTNMNAGSGIYGHTDWRLPNRKELRSLVDYSKFNVALPAGYPFTNVQSHYWSSTTFAYTTSQAWNVPMEDGFVFDNDKGGPYNIWPVRAGQVGNLITDKAIIVAGSGPNVKPSIWTETTLNTGLADFALKHQGFSKSTIYYLSYSFGELDPDGVDNIDALTSKANLQQAITVWAAGARNVIIYLIGHGEVGTFLLNDTETALAASDLSSWLDTLQGTISGTIVVVYDSCYSGSFLSQLKPHAGTPAGKRILITSTTADEQAYFVNGGKISFSNPFWNDVLDGVNIYDSFVDGNNMVSSGSLPQVPQIDANGNGIPNEKDDISIAQAFTIGNGIKNYRANPEIKGVVTAVLTGNTTGTIRVSNIVTAGTIQIQEVDAHIYSPSLLRDSAGNPITSDYVPKVVLNDMGSGNYEATYSGFTENGVYYISVFAIDTRTKTSLPVKTTVTHSSTSTPPHHPFRDFDGDGKSDILLQNSTSGAVAVWLMNGTATIGGGYVTTALDATWLIK